MSRTFRRKNQEQAFWQVKHCRLEWEQNDYCSFHLSDVPKGKDPFQVWLKKEFHSDKFFTMRNPGWWNKLYGTIPLRAHNKMNIRKIMKMKDIEDYPIFMKRARVPYYW